MADSSDEDSPLEVLGSPDGEVASLLDYFAAIRRNSGSEESSGDESSLHLLQDYDSDALPAFFNWRAPFNLRTTPTEDEEDASGDQTIEVDQGTCEGHRLKIQFMTKKSYTLDTATLDDESTPRCLKIILPRSVHLDQGMMSEPLHWACQMGQLDVIRILLNHGSCLHSQMWLGSTTPYFLASEYGHVEAIEMLLAHEPASPDECENRDEIDNWGKIIDNYDKWGNTAVHLACQNGHLDVVNVLLAHGASVDGQNRHAQLPLHLACSSGNVELVKVLLAKGEPGNVHSESEFGARPLHCACEGGHVGIAEALIASGACVEDADQASIRPIHVACRSGKVELVELLVSVGADINAVDDLRQTALHYACHYQQNAVVDFLLAHGAAIDARDNLGKTPLHWACEKGPLALVKSLLATGANCNLKDINRTTPLDCIGESTYHHLMMTGSHLLLHRCSNIEETPRLSSSTVDELTRALLVHGADPHAKYNGCSVMERRIVVRTSKFCGTILMEYGMDSGGQCRKSHACGKSELTCLFLSLPRMFLKGFAMYLCKTEAAGLSLPDDAKAAASRSPDVWSHAERDVFRAECEAELERVKISFIPNTSATYFDLLSRNLSALRGQDIIGNFDPYKCVSMYPIYGDMIGCSYIRVRRFCLINDSAIFFYLTEPQLPPECAEEVQHYLADKDLFTVLTVCRPRRQVLAVHQDKLDVIGNSKRHSEVGLESSEPTPSTSKKSCHE